MSLLKKGYTAVEEKAEQIKNALSGGGKLKFPFLYLVDSQEDPDPDRPSMAFGRFLDNDPITFNSFILEKGKVHFLDYEGSPLREHYKPSFRGVFPFLVYATDSEEYKNFLDSIEDEELKEETEARLIKVEEPTIYRAEWGFKALQTLQSINKRKKLISGDMFITRLGSGAQDTVYQFEYMGKSALSSEYDSLELPDWDELYKAPSPEEMEVYLTKGFEGLKAFRDKNKEAKKSDKSAAPSKKSGKKKSAAEDDDDEEVDVDWK